ncbi:MAG: M48 family metalloprotease [Cyclobacteriaceae bacterium]|nr:M48 family metalloprotease [Cyclobacteriaceae bacterium HetDA_MAG_MS6]
MSDIILYLLEVSIVLSILYLLYWLLLSQETFFSLNRFFLLAIPVLSLLFPVVNFDFSASKTTIINEPIEELSGMRISYYEALETWSREGLSKPAAYSDRSASAKKNIVNTGGTVLMVLLIAYAIGFVVIVSRLIWVYAWIYHLKASNPRQRTEGITVVKIPYQMAPFSFMNAVFVNENMLENDEFVQILAHEKTHIRQRHSLDLIFVQLLGAVLWFNPIVWFLIKSIKTTHEYIVDKKMINQGYSLVEYQSLLLRQLISNNSYGLVHNFNLSFIKKRITMMKIKESGWTGKAKVALALSTVVIFSLIMAQCNSRVIDDQLDSSLRADDLASEANSLNDQLISYSLPVLPKTRYKFTGDPGNSLEVTIREGQITINGRIYEVDEIESAVGNSDLTKHSVVVMKVDKDQSMSLVRDVQWELRKADRRKLLYIGRTIEGAPVEMPFLLPPVPGSQDGIQIPTIDDQYAQTHDISILKIELGNHLGIKNQQQVYDFVMDQMRQGKSNYVISAKHENDDSYGDYLLNLNYIQEGFNQIYQERAQKMFGKNFHELDWNKEQYNAVRKGIPRAISVAER